MKYVFILVLGIVAASGGLLGAAAVFRFVDNMTQTARIMPGERNFPMPAGVVPRGGELMIPREQRDLAAKRPNPVKMAPPSIEEGQQHYTVFCAPCHGPEGKGGVTGPVATKFIPTPDLTNAEFQKQRTDGYWHHVIMTGGAVMPAYGETMSATEAWHIVNFLRSIAAK
ncbi:MAG: cytochrome c [Candidatus Rokubacteria bacterium]|nr:cytochrome c [Candidatus Rokubacteria bacterium]